MRRFIPIICCVAVISTDADSVSAQVRQSPSPLEELQSRIDQRLRERHDDLVNFRRDLHRHPELAGRETRTAGVVAERLRMLGLEVRTAVGGHGIVAWLRGAKPGPVVAFRADMDAMASDAPDPVEFRSEVPGVRHICGHDIHTTVGVALAEAFSSIRNDLAGSLLLVFQPSEENAQGARAMLQAGALRDSAASAIFAVHTAPLEVGQIGTTPGVMLAGRDGVTITLTGSGDLAAAADHARQVVQAASTVEPMAMSVSGEFTWSRVVSSAADPTARNWIIQAVVAATSDAMRDSVKGKIRAGLDPLVARGVSYSIDYRARTTPGVTNHAPFEQEARGPLRAVVGDAGLTILTGIPAMFSEDFGFFQDEVPGVMYFLGVSNASKGSVGLPHSPQYVADEEAIFVGARGMAAVILSRMVARTPAAMPVAATPRIDVVRAEQYFKQAAALCQREAGRLWGVSLCGPMVFADPTTKLIATNLPAPAAQRPPALGLANTAIDWGGTRWSAFVWPLISDEEQTRGRVMLHELFHRVQPQLGLMTRDGVNDHLDTLDGRYWMQLEWRALAKALGASGAERVSALRDALAFRLVRRRVFPGAAQNEQLEEIREGLAQYTGTVASAASVTEATADGVRQLQEAPRNPTFVRTFAYSSGAAYGILLDVWRPGWTRTVKATDDLGQLLMEASGVRPADDPAAAAMRFGGPDLKAAEEKREKQQRVRVTELRRRFVDGPVLVVPNAGGSFVSVGVTPIPGAGTVYPGVQVTAEWGRLEAASALRSVDRSTITVPAPANTEGRTLSGDGWTLRLATGWIVRPGPRPGDFQVVRGGSME